MLHCMTGFQRLHYYTIGKRRLTPALCKDRRQFTVKRSNKPDLSYCNLNSFAIKQYSYKPPKIYEKERYKISLWSPGQAKYSSLPGCCAVSTGNYVPTFRKILTPIIFSLSLSSETSVTNYQSTKCPRRIEPSITLL